MGCVCGSDLWYYRGESPHAVGSIGHEFIGVVEDVGFLGQLAGLAMLTLGRVHGGHGVARGHVELAVGPGGEHALSLAGHPAGGGHRHRRDLLPAAARREQPGQGHGPLDLGAKDVIERLGRFLA